MANQRLAVAFDVSFNYSGDDQRGVNRDCDELQCECGNAEWSGSERRLCDCVAGHDSLYFNNGTQSGRRLHTWRDLFAHGDGYDYGSGNREPQRAEWSSGGGAVGFGKLMGMSFSIETTDKVIGFVNSKLQRAVEMPVDRARVFFLSPFDSCSNLHSSLESNAMRVGHVAPLKPVTQ